MSRRRTAILISGRGSNMRALVDAAGAADFPARVELVLSNRADAAGLDYAREAGIQTGVLDHRRYTERREFDRALHEVLTARGIELVCLAGFMRLLGGEFVGAWQDRLINIHPSLLPAFRGLHTHERVLEAGVRITGCTVHFVRPEMDTGPIIAQAAVPVAPGDTAETLAARVLAAEHVIYPKALALVAAGRFRIEGDVVATDLPVDPGSRLVVP